MNARQARRQREKMDTGLDHAVEKPDKRLMTLAETYARARPELNDYGRDEARGRLWEAVYSLEEGWRSLLGDPGEARSALTAIRDYPLPAEIDGPMLRYPDAIDLAHAYSVIRAMQAKAREGLGER